MGARVIGAGSVRYCGRIGDDTNPFPDGTQQTNASTTPLNEVFPDDQNVSVPFIAPASTFTQSTNTVATTASTNNPPTGQNPYILPFMVIGTILSAIPVGVAFLKK